MDKCSAYTMGRGICSNGFPVNAACMGAKCHCCGRPTDKIPACMREDLGSPWLDESGRPVLAASQAAEGERNHG